MGTVLITGSSGYIGSHTIIDLLESGYEIIGIDNFVNSYPRIYDQIEAITGKKIRRSNIDLCDRDALTDFFGKFREISAIIHFAALKSVEESVEKPLLYYRNNIVGLLNLLEAVKTFEISQFVFSSSCTVYGNPDELPVTEAAPLKSAESPYGSTKQISEQIINRVSAETDSCQFVILRYFNPGGAHESGLLGEHSKVIARNLVPIIMETACGAREEMIVFGDDYPTRDGTCVRDYIHISDLANAHTKALTHMQSGKQKERVEVFNLGSGAGITVLEAIQAFEEATGLALAYGVGPRRPGDVMATYSDFNKAQTILGWRPRRDIRDIMHSAWKWEKLRREINWEAQPRE